MYANVSVQSNPLPANSSARSNENSTSPSNGSQFRSLYDRFRSSSTGNGDNAAVSEEKSTEKVDNSTNSKKIKLLKDDEKQSAEDLVMLLLKAYLGGNEGSINENESSDASVLEELKKAVSAEKNGNTISTDNLKTLISKLMVSKSLPDGVKTLLSQFSDLLTKGAANIPIPKVNEDLVNKLEKLTAPVQENTESVTKELQTFKGQIIQEIKNLIVKNSDNEKVTGKIERDTIIKITPNYTGVIQKASSAVDKEKSNNDTKEAHNLGNKIRLLKQEGQAVDQANKTVVATQDSKDTKGKLSEEKEDKFLKSLLSKDDGKKEDKVNLMMNILKPDQSGEPALKPKTELNVSKATFTADVVKAVKFMDTNGLKELKVNINPKGLGELVITVTMEDGKLKASINASNRESYNLLMSNLNDMKTSMNGSEIRIQDLNIGIYNGDTTFFKDGSQQQGNNSQEEHIRQAGQSVADDETAFDETEDGTIDNQINILA